MVYDKYFEKIFKSSLEDWNYSDELETYSYKNDNKIIIKKDMRWLEIARDTCYVEWSVLFPNNGAYKKRFFLKNGDNIMKILYGVFVDECKCFIPLPNKYMNITKKQYLVGKIINAFLIPIEEYDKYLKKANIDIIQE